MVDAPIAHVWLSLWLSLGSFSTIIIAVLAVSACECESTQQEESGKMANLDGWLGRR
jgi:hypothetical protein